MAKDINGHITYDDSGHRVKDNGNNKYKNREEMLQAMKANKHKKK